MTSSGVVRRVDELGRIVIPREIRRTVGITDGTPMEIYLDKDHKSIVLSHYRVDTSVEVDEILADLEYEVDGLGENQTKQLVSLLKKYKAAKERNN